MSSLEVLLITATKNWKQPNQFINSKINKTVDHMYKRVMRRERKHCYNKIDAFHSYTNEQAGREHKSVCCVTPFT